MTDEEFIQSVTRLIEDFTRKGQSVRITIHIPEKTVLVEIL